MCQAFSIKETQSHNYFTWCPLFTKSKTNEQKGNGTYPLLPTQLKLHVFILFVGH